MVIVFSNSKGKYDFIVLTSINFALSKVGGPVVPYVPGMDVSAAKRIGLVGHGSVGKIEGNSAEKIAATLADPVRGVSRGLEKLIITSCYAGMQDGGKAGTSVAEILAQKLRGRGLGGLEIVGYNGPSIKNSELGSFAKVVDDTEIDAASDLQDIYVGKHPKLASLTTDFSGDMAAKAKNAAEQSKTFYEEFIEALDDDKLLLRGDEVARICVVLD